MEQEENDTSQQTRKLSIIDRSAVVRYSVTVSLGIVGGLLVLGIAYGTLFVLIKLINLIP